MAPALKDLLAAVIPALLATLVTAAMQQFPTEFVGSQHDSLHIALRVADPTLFPHDAFVESARHQPTYLWHAIGAVLPANMEAAVELLTLGVLLPNFLFFLAVAAVVHSFGGSPWAAAGAMAVLCGMGDPLVGANYIIVNHITASGIVAAPLLIAIALAVRGNVLAAFAILGLCANFHVLQSAYVGGLLLGGLLARTLLLRENLWRDLAALLAAIAVGALCALPVLFLIAAAPTDEIPEGWADAVLRGHVIHYFLFSQLPLQIIRTLSLLILGAALVAFWAWDSKRPHAPRDTGQRARGLFLAGVLATWVVGFLLIGGILSDVLHNPLAIKAQPLRATMWVLLIVVPAACVLLEELARRPEHRAAAWTLAALLAVMLVLNVLRPFSGAFNTRLTPFVVLFSVALLLAPFIRLQLDRYTAIIAALAFIGPASIIIVWLGIVPGLEVLATTAGFQLLVLILFLIGLFANTRPRIPIVRPHLCVAAAWITAFAITGLVLLGRVESNEPLLLMKRDPSWHQAAHFIAHNTPPDALLQADPRRGGLRTLTHRSVFYEQDDDGALYFDPSSLEWLRDRAQLLRVPMIKTYARPAPWPAANVPWQQLANDEGVTHALVPIDTQLPGQILYQNREWQVIDLRTAEPIAHP